MNNNNNAKRKRSLPTYRKSVDTRLKEIKETLGITLFEDKWSQICNEVRQLNRC